MTSVATFRLNEARAYALANALDEDDQLAALPVSLGEAPDGQWQVLVYFTVENEAVEAEALRRLSLALLGKEAPGFTTETLPDTDWVAQSLKGLPPVRAGRFLVHGRHDRDARRANDIAIEIEAGQAFGTGHHGTTAGCLLAIDRIARARPIANALDIGTGSGVLAIAIAKMTKAPVLASDIDPLAVKIACNNIRFNEVAARVRAIVAGSPAKSAFRMSAPYDLVVANILAEPLVALAPQICRLLAPGGTLVLSGLLPGQRARAVAAYRGRGLPLLRSFVLDGWLTLVFGRSKRKRARPPPASPLLSYVSRLPGIMPFDTLRERLPIDPVDGESGIVERQQIVVDVASRLQLARRHHALQTPPERTAGPRDSAAELIEGRGRHGRIPFRTSRFLLR